MIDLSLQKEVFIQYASTLSLMIDFVKYHSIQIVKKITELGSLIGNTQCGNFRTFLPPLRIYEKSILVILKPKYSHFDHLSSPESWIFGSVWHFQVWNLCQNQNSKPSRLVKQKFWTFLNQPKLISLKIRTAEKFQNSQLGCPGL